MKAKSRKQLEKENIAIFNALYEIAYCMSSKRFDFVEVTEGVNALSGYALDVLREHKDDE